MRSGGSRPPSFIRMTGIHTRNSAKMPRGPLMPSDKKYDDFFAETTTDDSALAVKVGLDSLAAPG